jgi:UDP-glucuronate 4-epimerase
VELLTYIACIEKALGKKAEMNLLPLQPGDVPDTYADVESLVEWVDYKPSVPVEEGWPGLWSGIGGITALSPHRNALVQ